MLLLKQRFGVVSNTDLIAKLIPLIQSFNSFSYSPSTSVVDEANTNTNYEFDFNQLFISCNKSTDLAKRLHALLLVSGEAKNIYFSTKLLNLYAYLDDISYCRLTFEQIPTKNVFAWNSMISGFVHNGCFREAINCYYRLLVTSSSRVRPDFYTFPVVLKACGDLVDGKKVHCWVLKLGFCLDLFIDASLIHMYSKFGFVSDARKVFDVMGVRDKGSWNAMISGFCQNGNAVEALGVFEEMKMEGVKLDTTTVSSVLPVCAPLGEGLKGILIHVYAIKHGLEFDVFVSNALINMYAKLGELVSSIKVFGQMTAKSLVSWNSLISAYEQNKDPISALKLFSEMMENKFQPDVFTLVSLASVVAQCGDDHKSRSIHGFIMRRGWMCEGSFIENAVMDMYAKLGCTDLARKVFERMAYKDVISWNTLITGYAQNGLASEAVEVFGEMEGCKGIVPDQGTLVSILPAFSHLGSLQHGMRVHGHSIKVGLCMDIFVGTCLIDLYVKCGRLDDAMLLFKRCPGEVLFPGMPYYLVMVSTEMVKLL